MTARELWRCYKERHDNPLVVHLDQRRRWLVRMILWAPLILAFAGIVLWAVVDPDSVTRFLRDYRREQLGVLLGWALMTLVVLPGWCLLAGFVHLIWFTDRWRRPRALEEIRLSAMPADEVWFGAIWTQLSAYIWQVFPVWLLQGVTACVLLIDSLQRSGSDWAVILLILVGFQLCSAVLFPVFVAAVCLRAVARPMAHRFWCAGWPFVICGAAYALAGYGIYFAMTGVDTLRDRLGGPSFGEELHFGAGLTVLVSIAFTLTRQAVLALFEDPGAGFMARDPELAADVRQWVAHEKFGGIFRVMRRPIPPEWRLGGLVNRWALLAMVTLILAASVLGRSAALKAERERIALIAAQPGGQARAQAQEDGMKERAPMRRWAVPFSLIHPAHIVVIPVLLAGAAGLRRRRRDNDAPSMERGTVLGSCQRMFLPLTTWLACAALLLSLLIFGIAQFLSGQEEFDWVLPVVLLGLWLSGHVAATHALLAVLTAKRPWLTLAVIWVLALGLRALFVQPVVAGDELRDFLFWVMPSHTRHLEAGLSLTTWFVGYSVLFGIPARLRRLYAMPGAVTCPESPVPQSD